MLGRTWSSLLPKTFEFTITKNTLNEMFLVDGIGESKYQYEILH